MTPPPPSSTRTDTLLPYTTLFRAWLEQSRGKPDAPFADYLLWRDPAHTEPEPFLEQARWEGYDGRHIEIAMVDMNRPEVQRYFERSEEHTSELQSLMRISYAVFCLKKQKHITRNIRHQ